MKSMLNILTFLAENWMTIIACGVLIYVMVLTTIDFLKKPREEQIEIAKAKISESMLALVTRLEKKYEVWQKAGALKRSEAFNTIFEENPILLEYTSKEELIQFIDDCIDDALEEMKVILENNKSKQEGIPEVNS